jgi:LytS/YehU family sensor histidine kinase
LSNVEQRLSAAYGADAHLTVGPDSRGGTSAVLDLPLRRTAPSAPRERAPA